MYIEREIVEIFDADAIIDEFYAVKNVMHNLNRRYNPLSIFSLVKLYKLKIVHPCRTNDTLTHVKVIFCDRMFNTLHVSISNDT